MATFAGIAATSEAIRALLERAARNSADFRNVSVKHYQSSDLQQALSADTPLTLSVFLHQVRISDALRNVPVRYDQNGNRLRPAIPVDLFYLITSWAPNAPMQQKLLGWAIRVIEDGPTLPSTLLNEAGWAGVFAPAEAVELVWHPLTMQEEYDLWQIAQSNQQPSASYVARTIALESTLGIPPAPLTQVREFEYQLEVNR